MAVDVKLLHIVSDNNLIKGVYRFVLSFEPCGDESVPVSRSSFRTRKTVLLRTPVA